MSDSENKTVFSETEQLVINSDKELSQFVESFNSGSTLMLPHLQPTIEVVLMFALAGYLSILWAALYFTFYYGISPQSIALSLILVGGLIILVRAYRSVRSHVLITPNGELKRGTTIFSRKKLTDLPLSAPITGIKLEIAAKKYNSISSWHVMLQTVANNEEKHLLNTPVALSAIIGDTKEKPEDIEKALKLVTRFRIMGRLAALRCQVPFIDSAYKDE